MTDTEKVNLALAVYESLFNQTDSFEDEHIGADLVYLTAAILKGQPKGFEATSYNRVFLKLLNNAFEPEHDVWKFIVGDLDKNPRY